MRTFSFFVLLLVTLAPSLASQTINSTKCDSTILTQEEFEKCRKDSLWEVSVIDGVNYISYIKTELLPKYRSTRRALAVPEYIQRDLLQLRRLYDSTVSLKLDTLIGDGDRNQMYVRPKSYVSFLLYLQQFKLYPDVYAMLLNPIHLQLHPKTSWEQQSKCSDMIKRISHSISTWNNIAVKEDSHSLAKQMRSYSPSIQLFQGAIDDEERSAYDIINYLLWTQ